MDAQSYFDAHWEEIRADLESLVAIPSVVDEEAAEPGAPFGPACRRALDAALGIAARLGLRPHCADGYIGFGDLLPEGARDDGDSALATPLLATMALGIIGHTDVVPAGPGWTVDPFSLTECEGYLMGRGVIDDKGPTLIALWALRYCLDEGVRFPGGLRFIFGSSEETGMADVAYYLDHFKSPRFVFTPDAEFPVCYGEKGMYGGVFSFPVGKDARIVELAGGSIPNAVAGFASATVRVDGDGDGEGDDDGDGEGAKQADEGLVHIVAEGKSAHASTPWLGECANLKLVESLLGKGLCSEREREILEFARTMLSSQDGAAWGLAAEDEVFGPLTLVGGVIGCDEGAITLSVDIRYPTSISKDEIEARVLAFAGELGAEFECTSDKKPFLVDPDSEEIQVLLEAFNEVTGREASAFTMGGGTYARAFPNAASFGAEMPWLETPEWAGGMHGPDEAVSIAQLRQSFEIYAAALRKLAALERLATI